jgi:hypothetical protein
METPNNRAGYLTEFVMQRIQTGCSGHGTPALHDGQYNRVYEAVYEVLFRELSRPVPPEPKR